MKTLDEVSSVKKAGLKKRCACARGIARREEFLPLIKSSGAAYSGRCDARRIPSRESAAIHRRHDNNRDHCLRKTKMSIACLKFQSWDTEDGVGLGRAPIGNEDVRHGFGQPPRGALQP